MTNRDRSSAERASPVDWAQSLRTAWERRARSSERTFYVASHRGCDDPEIYEAQARFDLAIYLHGLGSEALATMDVLEVGCGTGRLARHLAPLVRSYTGFDISPTMIRAARQRCGDLPRARFMVGSGVGIPIETRDRSYSLVFAHAVFIHCPRELVAAYIAAAHSVLEPGGEFRFQVRADPNDLEGLEDAAESSPLEISPPQLPEGPLTPEEARSFAAIESDLAGCYYMGHAFRFGELGQLLTEVVPDAPTRLRRFERELIHCAVVRGAHPTRAV